MVIEIYDVLAMSLVALMLYVFLLSTPMKSDETTKTEQPFSSWQYACPSFSMMVCDPGRLEMISNSWLLSVQIVFSCSTTWGQGQLRTLELGTLN